MNPIVYALRRPMTVMVVVVAVALGSILAVSRMSIDIFPNLNLPSWPSPVVRRFDAEPSAPKMVSGKR
jgi:tryptophan-rich sensory protein